MKGKPLNPKIVSPSIVVIASKVGSAHNSFRIVGRPVVVGLEGLSVVVAAGGLLVVTTGGLLVVTAGSLFVVVPTGGTLLVVVVVGGALG